MKRIRVMVVDDSLQFANAVAHHAVLELLFGTSGLNKESRPCLAVAKPVVLLLDDDERDLMLLEQILRPDGFPVLKTTDPARAFELLASHPVGIVISDQSMPGLTGVEFLSHVRRLHPDVIRIVFTNSRDPKVFADAVNEAGIHKFMMKDWDGERLRAEVREVSRRCRSSSATKIPPPRATGGLGATQDGAPLLPKLASRLDT